MPNAPADDQSFVAGRGSAQLGPDTAAPFRDTRRQLELISENFPEGALYQYAITGDGRHLLTYLGRGIERVFGDTPAAELPIDAAWLNRRINPADLNALAAARERSQRELKPLHAEVRIQLAGGAERWVSFRAQPRPLADHGVVWDGAIIDVTERRRAEESVRRQADFLAALNQTTLELLGRRKVGELLQALVARASLLLKSPHAEISLLEKGDLVLRAFSKDREYRGGERIRRGEPAISWRAVETRLPVVVDRYADHPESRDFHHAPGVHTAAVFPIVRASECVGVLGLAREQPGYPFTSEDLREGMLLAQMAALVLNNAAIHEEAVRDAEARTVALRESEERFRGVFDRSPIVMGLLAMPESRIVELNAAGLTAFGISREDAVGRTTLELGWWIDPAQRDRFLAELTTTGAVSGFETEMRRTSGETFTALLSGTLISFAGQSYSVSSLQDISARKQSEAARDRSLSLMRATLESTADAILVVSGEGRIETYNRNFAEMWGVDITRAGDREYETELLRKVLGQLVSPELFLTSLRDLYARSEDEVFDILVAKDGRVLERFSRPQMLGQQPVGRVWSFRDLTEQRQAEAALRRSEERFRVLADVSPVGIFSANPAGHTVFVNRRWCEIAGLTAEQAQGDGWMQALHPEDRSRVVAGWTEAARRGESSSAEFRFLRPDGTVTWLVGQSRVQLLADGTVAGFVGTITDVTALKRAEEERKRNEVQLRQSRKMESLGTLAGGIAHDFNNILTGTFGFVDLARLELPADHPAQAWLDRISSSSQRARDLVRQILTFSRKNETERLPQRLQPVVTEALKLLRSTLPPMVELRSRIAEDTPPVLADSTQIHQVVLNLCTNAWHAMPDGGRITVTLEPCTVTPEFAAGHADLTPGRWVRVTVADTGCGMDAATLEHIFEPFFTTKGTGLGTGLGLAVVHGIMKSHEGAIVVRSAPGEGSVFDLYFPPAPDDRETPPPPPGEIPRGQGERILVVDDDNVCGFAVEKMVESLGYVAKRHTRPEDALAEFASDPNAFDLVVSDLAMPGMDGAQLIQHLVKIRPDLPVIVITGFIESARQRLLDESPARAVMRKPVSRDDLGRAPGKGRWRISRVAVLQQRENFPCRSARMPRFSFEPRRDRHTSARAFRARASHRGLKPKTRASAAPPYAPMSTSAAGESVPASNPVVPKPVAPPSAKPAARAKPKYPGIRVTCNGNQLVTQYVETRITEGGVFYPITPSTEGGEIYQGSYAQGELNVWGQQKVAVETEGEHAAQGGATAFAVTGRRTVNFTSGQGIVYAMEQYYHAPGKLSTMVLEIGARALTKHALNVHCGHDDFYAALDTGWTMMMSKDAQQAADQAIIMRKVNELSLNPGMNIQDGMLTTHSERMYLAPEAEFLREFLGGVDDQIDCPTPAQRELFGPRRRRVPQMMDLRNPILLGPVQNQEHHMNGVVARRNNFNEHILPMIEAAMAEFGALTGRHYGLIQQYRTEDADTVFVSLGCAADNIEAACDYIRDHRNGKVGSIHINVIRPFPEAAVINALRGKKNVIILERTDEGLAGDNPLARDIRVALGKANEVAKFGGALPALTPEETPRLFRGSYGIGSRDFRPEHTLGAYEFVVGQTARKDGKRASDGETFFVLGVDHPYAVISKDTPSLLPEGAIAVRFHSIGGWGMITTGKNLGSIIGDLGTFISEQNPSYDSDGFLVEKLFVMANPKYGSEKKGAPTNYYLTVAPSPIKVNCELNHVDVVLCCDPKAFTHTNPLEGLKKGGSLVWESNESPEVAWERVPSKYRQWIKENNIRIFILPGFDIARKATNQTELQLRMQGNSFLGGFFRVSPFLKTFGITEEQFSKVVHKQYVKKFGRFGDAVVTSNMTVMNEGFSRVVEIKYGTLDDPDRSSMRNPLLKPLGDHQIIPTAGCAASGCGTIPMPEAQGGRAPLQTLAKFDSEFRAGLGYHQPAGALASVGLMGAGTGATQSKYVARRETPVYIAENCTQCMECITACPDTALPNTSQEVSTVLKTAINNYVSDLADRRAYGAELAGIETRARAKMNEAVKTKAKVPFADIIRAEVGALTTVSEKGKAELTGIIAKLPLAYSNVPAIFRSLEAKQPGAGGLFSIFVSDLCKGCGECVQVCGDHDALRMTRETEELNAELTTAQVFSRLLPDTPQKFLGLYNDSDAANSREAALRNHLMVRRNYEALVSGDGACAGCGEKSILRAAASVTEAYMRPLYHKKADRLRAKADRLEKEGVVRLEAVKARNPKEYELYRKTFAHVIAGLGGENDADTGQRIAAYEGKHGPITDEQIVSGLVAVMRQDAFNHKDLQAVDGRRANGMSVMMMGASTGCNTVYGSTPPSNPHPYPWMNSLFQDGATISWLMAESAILTHARRSVVPERLADALLDRAEGVASESEYFTYTHLDDALMTEQEIRELPKIWVIGGDGALGDIGFQNVSKVMLQNRPNVKMLMLDTQVYSNTGGQNSDSSTMLGGYDMNQFGVASQGKLIEKKNVAEAFTSGHGSPFVAQVSMANAAKLYKAMLDGLEYRGTAFFQSYTTCQPEHAVADNMSADQAKLVRDARGMPEFIYNPRRGETSQEAFDLKGNPTLDRDWWRTKYASNGEDYNFTVAHWALTEGRFRKHVKAVKEEDAAKLTLLDDILTFITQDDVIHRRVFDQNHRSFVPNFGCYIKNEEGGKMKYYAVSRQMVLFAVERRKAWRMLQSKAGVTNKDYVAQKALLAKVDKGEIPLADARAKVRELLAAEVATVK